MIYDIKKVIVKFNDEIVGYLVELENKKIAFQYDEEWIKKGFSISPLSLPLTDKLYIQTKDTFEGLYGVFWDSLPDGWGELLMIRLLAQKNIDYKSLSPLTKLTLINESGLGGLSYEPYQALINKKNLYNLDVLAKEIKKVLNDDSDVKLDDVFKLGGSSGGARPKAHIKLNGEEWIIKFPCKIDNENIGQEEYIVNKLARDCEINVNEFNLFPSDNCKGYFGAKRFDRIKDKRLHVISLAGMLEISHRTPNLDYGNLFYLIDELNGERSELYEAFKRMCFNVYIGNKDDHAKNFSFIYDELHKKYKLSPAYDLTITKNKFEHELTVNRKGNPSDSDLMSIARDFNLSQKKCLEIMESIKKKIKK